MTKKKSDFKYRQGQTIIIVALFFSVIAVTILLALADPALRQISQTVNLAASAQSFFAARSAAEDYLYRMNQNLPYPPVETLSVGSATASSQADIVGTETYISSTGDNNDLIRQLSMHIVRGDGTSFHYGLQSGIGGISLTQSSGVVGNIYSSGPITGGSQYNVIDGSIVSAGATGLVNHIYAKGDIYSHTITNTQGDKDAYYQTIDSYSTSHISGNKHYSDTDQQPIDLPIPDSVVEDWKAAASDTNNGAQIIDCTGSYAPTSDITIGPATINCDLDIKGHSITLSGPVWVKGNISIETSSTIVASYLGHKSVAFIADNPGNRTTSSIIDINQSAVFTGAGDSSYVLMLSMNDSAESGGTVQAINVSQTSQGALLVYAGHGLISISQSTQLKEITAYSIKLSNTAQVSYDQGLINLIFTSGPGGQYNIDWIKEI